MNFLNGFVCSDEFIDFILEERLEWCEYYLEKLTIGEQIDLWECLEKRMNELWNSPKEVGNYSIMMEVKRQNSVNLLKNMENGIVYKVIQKEYPDLEIENITDVSVRDDWNISFKNGDKYWFVFGVLAMEIPASRIKEFYNPVDSVVVYAWDKVVEIHGINV